MGTYSILLKIQFFVCIISFQTDLYFVHASCLFDYRTTVEDTIMCNIGLYLDVYEEMLKEKGQFVMEDSNYFLEIVEKKYLKSDKPWLFLLYAASVLVKEKNWFTIEPEVSEISIIIIKKKKLKLSFSGLVSKVHIF